MGFLDIFFGSPAKQLDRQCRRAQNINAQPEDREAAALFLAEDGSEQAIYGLLGRFDVRIENAKTIYQSIFSDEHPLAKKKKIELFEGFLAQVKDFKSKLGARAKKPEERDAVLAELSTFVDEVRQYRALQIDFPARRYATSNFFFIEVLPSLVTLQDQTTRINTLADALLQDAAVVDFIIRFRKERAAHPEKYTHHFWIKPPLEGDIESFSSGVRVLKMAQREKVKSNGKDMVEQAIVPEGAKNANEGVLVPVATIAALSLDSTVKTFEDQTLGRMLGRVMVRIDQLLEATKAVNLKPLKTSLEEQASKAPYFVL